MIPPVHRGQSIEFSADDENELRRALDKAGQPDLQPGSRELGQAGVLLHPPPPGSLIALFELTEVLNYPTSSSSSGVGPDVPFTYGAQLVWLNHNVNEHETVVSPTETLYHPVAFRDDAGWPFGIPTFTVGQRVFAVFNAQSGRWEILARAMDMLRFELGDSLLCSSSGVGSDWSDSVVAHEIDGVLDGDDDMPIRVWSGYRGLRGRGGGGMMRGAMGYAGWFADLQRWEIIYLRRTIWWGKLDGQLTAGGSQTVSIWWPNNATGVMEDSGCNVLAYEWLLTGVTTLASGSKVYLEYDEQYDRWWIVNGEGAYGA